MSCVVSIKHKDSVIIGADSASVIADWLETRRCTTRKIFRVQDFVIGTVGSFRTCQVLQHCFAPPPIPKDDDIHRYLVADFIPVLKDTLKFHGIQATQNSVDSMFDSSLLIAYGNTAYRIGMDYQVSSMDDGYDAIGISWQYALASFYATRAATDKPLERALEALETSAFFNAGVTPPFHFYITSPGQVSDLITVDKDGNVNGLSSGKDQKPSRKRSPKSKRKN